MSEVLAGLFDLVAKDSVDDECEPTSLLVQASTASSSSGFWWRGIRIRPALKTESSTDVTEFKTLFDELGVSLDEDNISDWLNCDFDISSGVEIYSDQEICDLVSPTNDNPTAADEEDEDEEDDEEEKCTVSNSQAAYMFEQCLAWLEFQPEASVYNTTLLQELHSLASTKRMASLKQSSIGQYFK